MEKKEETTILALNDMQKCIIDATLIAYFDDMEKLEPELAIKALKAILSHFTATLQLTHEIQKRLENANVLDDIIFIRKILYHPYPQNSNEGYYKDSKGNIINESEGLLNLTCKNDNTADPVTKEAVVNYITQVIHTKIREHENRLKAQPANNNSSISSYPNPFFSSGPNPAIQTSIVLTEAQKSALKQLNCKHANEAPLDRLYKSDTKDLTNPWHIIALAYLKYNGLTADTLLKLEKNGIPFDETHCRELVNLVKASYVSVETALGLIYPNDYLNNIHPFNG